MFIKDWLKRYFYVMKFIVVILLFFSISQLQRIPIILFDITKENVTDSTYVLLSLFSNTVFTIILIAMYWKDLKKEFGLFKKSIGNNIDCGIKYWLLGLAGMIVSNIIIQFILGQGQATNEQSVQKMITALPWVMVLNAGLIAPFIEELCFRKTFRDFIQHKWIFILVSGVVFGALHVVLSDPDPLEYLFIIPYSSLGVAFAYMYSKTETVYTSVFMHMFHNTALTLLSFLPILG